MKTEFTSTDISRFGIRRERLKVWLERGWISPELQRAKGAGTRNLFSREDLFKILIFKSLLEHGFTGEVAHARLLVFSYIRSGEVGFENLPKEQQEEAKRQHERIKQQTQADLLVFPHTTVNQSDPGVPFYGWNENDEYSKLSEILLRHRDAVVVNVRDIRSSIDRYATE